MCIRDSLDKRLEFPYAMHPKGVAEPAADNKGERLSPRLSPADRRFLSEPGRWNDTASGFIDRLLPEVPLAQSVSPSASSMHAIAHMLVDFGIGVFGKHSTFAIRVHKIRFYFLDLILLCQAMNSKWILCILSFDRQSITYRFYEFFLD